MQQHRCYHALAKAHLGFQLNAAVPPHRFVQPPEGCLCLPGVIADLCGIAAVGAELAAQVLKYWYPGNWLLCYRDADWDAAATDCCCCFASSSEPVAL